MTLSALFGNEAKMYRNTGTYASPTWVEMDNIGDVTDDINHEQVEIPLRSGGNLDQFFFGRTSVSLTVNLSNVTPDANIDAIWDAFRNKTTLDLLVLDRDKDAEDEANNLIAKGFRCDFGVFGHPRDQAVKSVQSAAVVLRPVISANPIVYYPLPA